MIEYTVVRLPTEQLSFYMAVGEGCNHVIFQRLAHRTSIGDCDLTHFAQSPHPYLPPNIQLPPQSITISITPTFTICMRSQFYRHSVLSDSESLAFLKGSHICSTHFADSDSEAVNLFLALT
jgi:hypothetical protein